MYCLTKGRWDTQALNRNREQQYQLLRGFRTLTMMYCYIVSAWWTTCGSQQTDSLHGTHRRPASPNGSPRPCQNQVRSRTTQPEHHSTHSLITRRRSIVRKQGWTGRVWVAVLLENNRYGKVLIPPTSAFVHLAFHFSLRPCFHSLSPREELSDTLERKALRTASIRRNRWQDRPDL